MKCEEVSELLPELLAGSLGREAEQEVLAHLARCGECRGELAFWAQAARAIKAEAADMPDETFEGIRERLFGESVVTVWAAIKTSGRALGLAGSACKLALATIGLNP